MDPMRSGEEEELSSDLQAHGGEQLIEEVGPFTISSSGKSEYHSQAR